MPAIKRLAIFLKNRRLTHERFAAMADVPAPMLSLWLRGKRGVSLATAFKIELATGGAVPAESWLPRGLLRRVMMRRSDR